MQAALFLREKQELRKKKLKIRRRRYELPAHVATRDIAPFPQFPPNFWGKAAWQDREPIQESEARESLCIPSEAAVTHRTKQREAHRRWVKRNRIHDLSFGDCSSDEELIYGVQNGAANLLLYVGLGTMCVGMIIAFVGTGEKGFKTMELRLIGPCLIVAGILIIIFRVLLCVCPSKCLKLKKQKHKFKNSTNKLNSEGSQISQENSFLKETTEVSTKEKQNKSNEGKKRVSIAMLPTTSGLSADFSENLTAPKAATTENLQSPTLSFLENEKQDKLQEAKDKKLSNLSGSENKEEGKSNCEQDQLYESDCDTPSLGCESSFGKNFFYIPETLVSPNNSDISITSVVDVSHLGKSVEVKNKIKTSKFEVSRTRRNKDPTEIVLTPFNLSNTKDTE